VTIEVTGVTDAASSRDYGGQSIARVQTSPGGVTLTVDAALDR